MSLKGMVFFPPSPISVGVVVGLTRYLPKLCKHNVTKVNNDQRETKCLPVLRVGVQRPHKNKVNYAIFLVSVSRMGQKRLNEWVKRVNRVMFV